MSGQKKTRDRIIRGLTNGRVRDVQEGRQPSANIPAFVDALSEATVSELHRALDLLIGKPTVKRTQLGKRIEAIAERLSEIDGNSERDWQYAGPATVTVYGGGLLVLQLNAPEFPQGAPDSGGYTISLQLEKSEAADDR